MTSLRQDTDLFGTPLPVPDWLPALTEAVIRHCLSVTRHQATRPAEELALITSIRPALSLEGPFPDLSSEEDQPDAPIFSARMQLPFLGSDPEIAVRRVCEAQEAVPHPHLPGKLLATAVTYTCLLAHPHGLWQARFAVTARLSPDFRTWTCTVTDLGGTTGQDT